MTQSRTRSRLMTRQLIKGLAVMGAAGTVIVAPNSAQLFDKILSKRDRKNAAKTLASLKYRRLVEVRKVNGHVEYRLSSKGWDIYEKIQINDITIATPQRWDGKWRVIGFDLPAGYTARRRNLLYHLHRLDFYKLQDSLWVHPFDCEKPVGALLNHLHIEDFVTFMVVDQGSFADKAEKYFIDRKKLI